MTADYVYYTPALERIARYNPAMKLIAVLKGAVFFLTALARAIDALRWEPRDMPAHIGYICAVSDPDGNIVEFSHNQQVFSAIKALWGGAS